MTSEALSDEELERFRQRLAGVLETLRLSRREVGARLGGKSSQYVSLLISGAAKPSRKRIVDIERALDLAVGSLTRPGAMPGVVFQGDERYLAPDLAEWASLLRSARDLRAKGLTVETHAMVDRLIERLQSVRTPGPQVERMLVEALILRCELQYENVSSDLAVEDGARARRIASSRRSEDPELFARAYFWHVVCHRWRYENERLSEVLTDTFPEGLDHETAFLPWVVELLIRAGEQASLEVVADHLARAIADVPFSPEKSLAFLALESWSEDGGEHGERWIREAGEAGDALAIAQSLYHGAQRRFLGGATPEAYAMLLEATQAAIWSEGQRRLGLIADLWAQVLRLPMVRRALAEGVTSDDFDRRIASPASDLLREIGLREDLVGNPRAWAWAAATEAAALLGRGPEALECAERVVAYSDESLGPPDIAASLAWAAEALADTGDPGGADRLYVLAEEQARAVFQDPGVRVAARGLADLVHLQRAPRWAAALLAQTARALVGWAPNDVWWWALLAKSELESGRLRPALEAAQRGLRILEVVDPALAFSPLPMYVVPLRRPERQAAARQQAMGWLRTVLEAASTSTELPEFVRDHAREALDALPLSAH